ncbi:PQQ-dependent sugar dehydrogenase [Streptomyces bohaiensis]|uniref:PQQ-dependent sugar dehydrogenase n=1 Tax=Streptomyces bohaiensis TaxID=1431344 RepID=UPI003B7F73C7
MARYGPGGTRSAALALTAALAVLATGCAGGPAADRAAQLAAAEQRESPSPAPAPDDDAGGGPSGGEEPGTPGAPDGEPEPTPTDPPAAPAEGSATVERTFALDGVSAPWGLAVLPDGALLIGSRDTGTVHRLDPDTGDTTTVGTIPGVDSTGGTGLLGLAADDGSVYAYYAAGESVRIGRFSHQPDREEGQQLGAFSGMVTGLPRAAGDGGGRIGLGPDGHFYASVGSDAATVGEEAAGSLLRTTMGGAPPAEGNAAAGSPLFAEVRGAVEGFAWDEVGRTWYVDDRGDLGVIPAPDDTAATPQTRFTWPPGAAPTGVAYRGSALWITDESSGGIWRVPLNGPELVDDPRLITLDGFASPATVVAGGAGLWVLDPSGVVAEVGTD